eukprot:Skav219568  [mRNA]  locus=scaffold886:117352:118863:- [translate_table: standard]
MADDPNRVRDASAEELSDLPVGTTTAHWYSDDDVWHERIILWPSMRGDQCYYVLTPDDHVYCEDLRLRFDVENGPSRVRVKGQTFRYWSRFRESSYRFNESVDNDYLKAAIIRAMEEVKAQNEWNPTAIPSKIIDRKGKEVSSSVFLGRALVPRRLGRLSAATAIEEVTGSYAGACQDEVRPIEAAPEGHLWISEEATEKAMLGEEVDVRPAHGVSIGRKIGLAQVGSGFVRVRLVKVEEGPKTAEELLSRYRQSLGIHSGFVDEETQRALGGAGKAEDYGKELEEDKQPEDARVLAVDFDSQGDRFKEFREAVNECKEHSWPDWPLEGPLTTLHLVKHMARSGGTPKTWLNEWARFKEVNEQDRVMFELRTLVDALHLGCCYDQVNVASLASFETISRRIQAIVDAFAAGTRGSPDWGSAKIITNYRGPEDAVSPQLKTWASRKGKEEADLASARSKMREARRGVASEEAGAVAEGSLPTAKGGGKSKRKTGRGLAAPAAEQ